MAQLKKRPSRPSKSKPNQKPKRASRDPQTPPNLVEFMMKDWRSPPKRAIAKIDGAPYFKARRRRLSRRFSRETVIIPTGHEKTRANDTTWHFRAGSDFYYLTGNREPDCVLVLAPKAGGGHEEVLFVEPNPGRSDESFFTDRAKGELWVGPRLGLRQSKQRFGVHRTASLADLPAFLKRVAKKRHRVLRHIDPAVDRRLPKNKKQNDELAAFLSEQRLIKDAFELAAIRRACVATRRGFEEAVRALKHAKSEREIEAAFDMRARIEGNGVGYATIAAAGHHACILHWTQNDAPLKRGDLILIDAGVEMDDLYTGDITRVFPIGGKFTRTQRQIYDLVLAAQKAAIRAVKPGADFLAPNRASQRVLTEGLVELGLLRMDADEALDEKNQYHRRYTLHGVSHMLGIDVHDCAQARPEKYRNGKMKPGMVFTVEPGLYFQKDDLTVPPRFRGIGVRLEEDVLVTKRGCRVLTDVPREARDVETWMRDLWRK